MKRLLGELETPGASGVSRRDIRLLCGENYRDKACLDYIHDGEVGIVRCCLKFEQDLPRVFQGERIVPQH